MAPSARNLTKSDFESISEIRYRLRRFERFSARAAHDEGITLLQYLVLVHLKGAPGRDWLTVGELAERLQLQAHGAVALVTRCEALELIERRPSTTDRRQVEVHLLPKGERVLKRLVELHRLELASLRGGLLRVPQIEDPS